MGSPTRSPPMQLDLVRTSRGEVLLGPLPDSFLRIRLTPEQQAAEGTIDPTMYQQIPANAAHNYLRGFAHHGVSLGANIIGRLDITIIEARLVKNYGVARMDPYVRLRVGHQVFETRTALNGARNPKWNKIFHFFIQKGVDCIHFEIYDERAFSEDEKIAWITIPIDSFIVDGTTREEWVELNGKQGDHKEGELGLVFTFTSIQNGVMAQPSYAGMGMGMMPGDRTRGSRGPAALNNVYVDNTRQAPVAEVVIKDEDVDQLREMFPSLDKQVIRTILENERGNKDRAINGLLNLTAT